eukprot:gene12420-biopygen14016
MRRRRRRSRQRDGGIENPAPQAPLRKKIRKHVVIHTKDHVQKKPLTRYRRALNSPSDVAAAITQLLEQLQN